MVPYSAVRRLFLLHLSSTTVPLGGERRLEMALGCYLVECECGRRILIDSGIAAETRPDNAPLARNETNVLEQLDRLSLRPGDIDTVICTHFDVDHCGFHDSFSHAEFVVQRAHSDLARSGHSRFESARAHWDHPALRYRVVDGDTEVLPGLTLLETSGHTTGHQSVLLRLPYTGTVLLAIDAVMMQSLFTPDRKAWPNDEDEEQLRASTRKLLAIAENENVALTVFGHDGAQWETLKTAPEFYD